MRSRRAQRNERKKRHSKACCGIQAANTSRLCGRLHRFRNVHATTSCSTHRGRVGTTDLEADTQVKKVAEASCFILPVGELTENAEGSEAAPERGIG